MVDISDISAISKTVTPAHLAEDVEGVAHEGGAGDLPRHYPLSHWGECGKGCPFHLGGGWGGSPPPSFPFSVRGGCGRGCPSHLGGGGGISPAIAPFLVLGGCLPLPTGECRGSPPSSSPFLVWGGCGRGCHDPYPVCLF